MDESMTATKLLEQRDLIRQRHAEMADNRASLPTPPWYAGLNPHSKLIGGPIWAVFDRINDYSMELLANAEPGAVVRVPRLEDFGVIIVP